jgi:hypothetical protein
VEHICEGCRQPERDRNRFLVCKSCNEKMLRQVYYCSRYALSPNDVCRSCPTLLPQDDLWKGTHLYGRSEPHTLHRRVARRHGVPLEAHWAGARWIPPLTRPCPPNVISRRRSIVRLHIFLTYWPAAHDPSPIHFALPLPARRTETAICTGDPKCVRARSETVVQAFKHTGRPFIDRFVEEYGSVAAFPSKVMQAWTDGRRGSIDTTMTPQ